MLCSSDFGRTYVQYSLSVPHVTLILLDFLLFQIDIPTLITETLGKEGLKHLEMYLRAKEKGCYLDDKY